MKIAVVTCDARMNEVYKSLLPYYEVIELHEDKDFSNDNKIDVLVLPVKGITEDGNLRYAGKTVMIPPSFWQTLSSDCMIFSGIPQEFIQKLPNVSHCYMEDENVLRKNAVLTAEGILFLLIDNTARGIQQMKIDIIGYGRCGKALYAWLDALRVPCRIIRREEDGGAATLTIEEWKKQPPGDVIVNTSVQKVIDNKLMDSWKEKPLIIDIATPDVIDSEFAKSRGIRFMKAGNLPSLIAYESAGRLIADYVREVIEHGK